PLQRLCPTLSLRDSGQRGGAGRPGATGYPYPAVTQYRCHAAGRTDAVGRARLHLLPCRRLPVALAVSQCHAPERLPSPPLHHPGHPGQCLPATHGAQHRGRPAGDRGRAEAAVVGGRGAGESRPHGWCHDCQPLRAVSGGCAVPGQLRLATPPCGTCLSAADRLKYHWRLPRPAPGILLESHPFCRDGIIVPRSATERTRVKICGLTTVEHARVAADLGADAIGLVFYAASSRHVSLQQALQIREALPAFVTVVGPFVDPSEGEVESVLKSLHLDCLQFHGAETAAFCRSFGLPYMKALRVRDGLDISAEISKYSDSSAILLDSFDKNAAGGTGTTFDWQVARRCVQESEASIVLAGGL